MWFRLYLFCLAGSLFLFIVWQPSDQNYMNSFLWEKGNDCERLLYALSSSPQPVIFLIVIFSFVFHLVFIVYLW